MQLAGVDVWFADLEAAGPALDALRTLVPDQERAQIAGMAEQLQARRWSRARIALRLVLATHIGLARARAPFLVSPRGKPSLAMPGTEFSISHSGDLCLLAVSSVGPLGVDIETRATADLDERRRAAIECAAEALAPHILLPAEDNARRFIQAWTRLEAVAKASGIGIGHLLTELAIQGPSAGLAGWQMPPADTLLAAQGGLLRVEDLMLDTAGAAAIALPREADLVVRTLPSSPSGIDALVSLAQGRG